MIFLHDPALDGNERPVSRLDPRKELPNISCVEDQLDLRVTLEVEPRKKSTHGELNPDRHFLTQISNTLLIIIFFQTFCVIRLSTVRMTGHRLLVETLRSFLIATIALRLISMMQCVSAFCRSKDRPVISMSFQ